MHIKLVSNINDGYRHLMPTIAGIAFGWIMLLVGLFASYLAFAHNTFFAQVLLLPVCVFGTFLVFYTGDLVKQSSCDYILEINDHDASFCKLDRLHKKKSTKLILLGDIKYAEYYPYLDCASIIFHTAYAEIEIPLWPMGERARDAVDFLAGKGVKIVDVQSDDPIPDEDM